MPSSCERCMEITNADNVYQGGLCGPCASRLRAKDEAWARENVNLTISLTEAREERARYSDRVTAMISTLEADRVVLCAKLAAAEKVVETMRRIASGGYAGASHLAAEALAAYDSARGGER